MAADGDAAALTRRLLARCSFRAEPPAGERLGTVGAGTELSCAVSGGSDSLALLVLAAATGDSVVAYHVDHGLRPGSAAEADVVAESADRLGCRFVALRRTVEPGPNLEARARAARLAALPPGTATGHTADDQAETVLLRLLRGSGPDGLAAMRPGPRHPILSLRRSEAAELVSLLGLRVVRDPSNDDLRFARNRVRHELLPLCCGIAGRDVVPLLARAAGLAAEEATLLDALASAIDPTDARALCDAEPVLARRAVRSWLRAGDAEGRPPGSAAVERVLAVAAGKVVACELEGGRRVRRSKGRLGEVAQ